MIVIFIGAMMTAIVTLVLLRPLARAGEKRAVLALSCFIPLAALGLYLWVGHPDMKTSAAMFERAGPRAERRALVAQELTLMQALSQSPDSVRLMLALGDVQMKQGHIDEAVRILEMARGKAPKNHEARAELGAAYYAKGIRLLMDEETGQAKTWLEKAAAVAPGDVSYRKRLVHDLKALRDDRKN
jgi:cytochrome c-type biogenesis protein CcmH/NrfG